MVLDEKSTELNVTPLTLLCLGLVFLLSYFTYFQNFQNPQGFFWDENYHVTSAQKYLNDTFFMHGHPPLGKLLMAAGEKFIDASTNDTQYVDVSKAKGKFSDGFSITGYRFIPTLLAWLTAPIIFLIFFLITRSPIPATLLSFLYIFDNALIVHMRGAMLEGPLIFFTALTILFFFVLTEQKYAQRTFITLSFLFGISFTLALLSKVLGLILILFVPALLLKLHPDRRRMVIFLLSFLGGFLVTFITVWQVHFSLTGTVNPQLKNDGFYSASEEYREILQEGKNTSLLSFPVMLRDSIQHSARSSRKISALDLCKVSEDGSPFFFWPFGARSIDYRRALAGEQGYRYLYLQANPAIWLSGLLGIIFATSFLIGSVFFPANQKPKNRFFIAVFLGMYVSYMIVVSQIDRVMYLYHYFIPLLFSFILFGLMVVEIRQAGLFKLNDRYKTLGLIVLSACIFLTYLFYSPLTYYKPITDEALQKRAIFPLWELQCASCERSGILAKPTKTKRNKK